MLGIILKFLNTSHTGYSSHGDKIRLGCQELMLDCPYFNSVKIGASAGEGGRWEGPW